MAKIAQSAPLACAAVTAADIAARERSIWERIAARVGGVLAELDRLHGAGRVVGPRALEPAIDDLSRLVYEVEQAAATAAFHESVAREVVAGAGRGVQDGG